MATPTSSPAEPSTVDPYSMVAVARQDENVFTGIPVDGPFGRVFGGQLVGQAILAAAGTVEPLRAAHSFHGNFLRPGLAGQALSYEVARVKDGRAFSVRTVRALQEGRLVLTATVSFQEPRAAAPGYQAALDEGYPGPDELSTGGDGALAGGSHRTAVELRRVPKSALPLNGTGRQAVWLRVRGAGGTPTRSEQRATLAMASDFTVLEPVLAGHGITRLRPGLSVASLDHAFWWHGDADPADWILYIKESPWSGDERGLVAGRLYGRSGALVASIAQEGLVRATVTP